MASWRRHWTKMIPFYAFPSEVRRLVYTTNAIEALYAKLRRAVRAHGHRRHDDAVVKLLFLVLNLATKEWRMPAREWTAAKAQFAILFEGRFTTSSSWSHTSFLVGPAKVLPRLPPPQDFIADRGYDTARFWAALEGRGIVACIPSTRSRKQSIAPGATLYCQRHRFEIMFGRLEDWCHTAMRYDRCVHAFFGAITLAATATFWLHE